VGGGTVTLIAIQITPADVSLPLHYSKPYTATGVYSDSSTQDLTALVTWSVAPSSLATISTAGVLATSTATGSGTVSAALDGVTGTTPVKVTSATLQSVEVAPSTASVPVGATQVFTATGLYKDSSNVLSNYDVTGQPGGAWKSSNTTAGTIDSTGLATALAAGQTSITFTVQSVVSGAATMTVPSGVTLASINIDQPDPVQLYTSGAYTTTTLSATAIYSDNSTVDPAPVTWSLDPSSAAGVVSVDATTGLVTALSAGTATVDASYGSFTDTITVQVSDVTLNSITVSSVTPTVPLSLGAQYTATGSFSDGTSGDITSQVTWTVQSTAIAGVSNASGTQGQVTPLAAGATTVVATIGCVSGSASLTVTSATLVSIALTPSGTTTLPLGFNEQFTAQGTYSDNSVYDVTTEATWVSSSATVATVSNAAGIKGVVSALASGTTNVRANIGSIISPATVVTVDVATLESISITPTSVTMKSNTYQQFKAAGTFSDGTTGLDITKQVNWFATKQKHIVGISNAYATKGLAHASRNTKKTGTVTVTASLNGVTSNSASISKTSAIQPIAAFDALGRPVPAAETATSQDASSGSGGVVAPLMLLGGAGAVWVRRRRRRRQAG
jgi:hypothetical protein